MEVDMTIIEECKALRSEKIEPNYGLEVFRGKKNVAVIVSELSRELGQRQEQMLLDDISLLNAADVALIRVYNGRVTSLSASEPGLRSKLVRSQLDANSVVEFCVALVDKQGAIKFRGANPLTGAELLQHLALPMH